MYFTDALYQAGEKSALESSGDLLSSKDKGVPNPFAQEILNEMSTWEEGCIDNDGYLLFLCVTPRLAHDERN